MKCKNCVNLYDDWCGMKADSPDPELERDCHWFAQKTNADRLRDMSEERRALDSVTWYNGLAPVVFSWIELKDNGYSIGCPNNYGAAEDWSGFDVGQLQLLWMCAVKMFGDYGTSPRFGWITDVAGFRKWILDITELWRGSEEYKGPEEYRYYWEAEEGK